MNRNIIWIGLLSLSFSTYSQKYEFQTVKEIKCTPVLSQGQTGTCWSYSSTSFLESEIMRISGKSIDLSEMYNVRHTYMKKAWNYIMRQGKAQFGEGGLNHDVIHSAKKHGIVPLNVFTGLKYNTTHNHKELEKELETLIKNYTDASKKLDPKWKDEVNTILDKHLGQDVKSFVYEGKNYTPISFLEMTGLKMNDYITISSFSHEPFYEKFILDIPDNFSNESFYNLPLDEFIKNIDYALDNGFTLGFDGDVSEPTFSAKHGIAVMPKYETDYVLAKTEIVEETDVTQEFRQQEFENFNTTDDHLMHIVGKLKDQKGNLYYKIKNSWGSDKNGHEGYIYMSVPYLKLKCVAIMLHKDGLTKQTRKNLDIK